MNTANKSLAVNSNKTNINQIGYLVEKQILTKQSLNYHEHKINQT